MGEHSNSSGKAPQDHGPDQAAKTGKTNSITAFLAIGIALGVVFGAAFGNAGLGICFGAGLGVAAGAAVQYTKRGK